MSDDELLETLARMAGVPNEYEPEAIAVLRAEVACRRLTPARQREAAERRAGEWLESLRKEATDLALQGRSEAQIQAHLEKRRGLDAGAASAIAGRAWNLTPEQLRHAGRRNLAIGAVLCLVGVATTAATWLRATTDGGGPYIVMYGVTIVGILQLVRGARQSGRSRTEEPPSETSVDWTENGRSRSITFDTAPFGVVRREPGRTEWRDLHENRMVAVVDRHGADVTTACLEIRALRAHHRREAAARGGGIVSVDLVRAGGVAAVAVVTKFPPSARHAGTAAPGTRLDLAYTYEGLIMVPLRDARLTVTLRARERGVTGAREAALVSHLLSRGLLRIAAGPPGDGPRRMDDLLLDPYDPDSDGSACCSLDDDERLDQLFPDHPLSRVRRWLVTVSETLEVAEDLRLVPDCDAPVSERKTRVSDRVPSAMIGLLYLQAGQVAVAEALFEEAGSLAEGGKPAGQRPDVAE